MQPATATIAELTFKTGDLESLGLLRHAFDRIGLPTRPLDNCLAAFKVTGKEDVEDALAALATQPGWRKRFAESVGEYDALIDLAGSQIASRPIGSLSDTDRQFLADLPWSTSEVIPSDWDEFRRGERVASRIPGIFAQLDSGAQLERAVGLLRQLNCDFRCTHSTNRLLVSASDAHKFFSQEQLQDPKYLYSIYDFHMYRLRGF